MRRLWYVFPFFVSLVIFVNIAFYLAVALDVPWVSGLYQRGLVVRFPQLGYVAVFAHGGYDEEIEFSECDVSGWNCNDSKWLGYVHTTRLNGRRFPTRVLLDELRGEGYSRIWLSQCETGDHPFVEYNGTTGEGVRWGDDVSRKTDYGDVYPVFWGFGFWRL